MSFPITSRFNFVTNFFFIMKKTAILLLFLLPIVAGAVYLGVEQNGTLSKDEVATDNLYAAGPSIVVAGSAQRDAVIGAANVLVTGKVEEDLLVASGVVDLFGDVGGDARIVAGKVTVGSAMGGDLAVGAGSVTLLPRSIIQGELIAIAGYVVIDGTVNGNVEAKGAQISINGVVDGSVNFEGEELLIGSTAVIGGNVIHSPETKLIIQEGAVIRGEKKIIGSSELLAKTRSIPGAIADFVGAMFFFKLFATLLAGILAVIFLPRLSSRLVSKTKTRFGRNLLIGLVVGIVGPALALLLCITIVGFILGVTLFIFLLLAFLVAQVYAGVVLGGILFETIFKREKEADWKQAVVGVIVLYFLWFIPLFGGIIAYVFTLATFGAIIEGVWNRLKVEK